MFKVHDNRDCWRLCDRIFALTPDRFIKRDVRPNEAWINIHGKPGVTPWQAERLQNEAAALQLIAENTTIRVPKVISFKKVWGVYQLEVERLRGVNLNEMKNDKEAFEIATNYITTTVLPQLRELKSRSIGALTGRVMLAPRAQLVCPEMGMSWPARASPEAEYVFCHNDLSLTNIMFDADTREVTGVIDWEYAGFYPPDFEAPLWTSRPFIREYYEIGIPKFKKVVEFLSDPDAVSYRKSQLKTAVATE